MGNRMELALCHPPVGLNFVVALRFLKNFRTAGLLDGKLARRSWRKTPLVLIYHNPLFNSIRAACFVCIKRIKSVGLTHIRTRCSWNEMKLTTIGYYPGYQSLCSGIEIRCFENKICTHHQGMIRYFKTTGLFVQGSTEAPGFREMSEKTLSSVSLHCFRFEPAVSCIKLPESGLLHTF